MNSFNSAVDIVDHWINARGPHEARHRFAFVMTILAIAGGGVACLLINAFIWSWT